MSKLAGMIGHCDLHEQHMVGGEGSALVESAGPPAEGRDEWGTPRRHSLPVDAPAYLKCNGRLEMMAYHPRPALAKKISSSSA